MVADDLISNSARRKNGTEFPGEIPLGQDEDPVRGGPLGTSACVRQPLDFNAFIDAARVLGPCWLVLNEPAPGRRPA